MSSLGLSPARLYTVVLSYLLGLQIIYALQNPNPVDKPVVTSGETEEGRGVIGIGE